MEEAMVQSPKSVIHQKYQSAYIDNKDFYMREKLVDAGLIKVRDKSIDIAKGIILMIVGHCSFCFVDYSWVIRGIYSFYLALFFIMSVFFIKEGLILQYKKN